MPPYDYDKTQLRAVVQGVYETLVRERLGMPAERSFGSGSRRLDVRALRAGALTREDISDLMGRAFAIAVAQGQRHGSIKPGTLTPTRQGVSRAYARLARGWSDEDYETSLALARKARANPLPAAAGAAVAVGARAAGIAGIGMLAWEGYQWYRKRNPRIKQIARAGEGSALNVRGRRPEDPQLLRGGFAIVPWSQDPAGLGYITYTADRIFPAEAAALRQAGMYVDRGLEKIWRPRGEGEVERLAEERAEAMKQMDPTALARAVGPSSEVISRDLASKDPLYGWLRSEDALAFFRAYPPLITPEGNLDLPEEYAEEIGLSVFRRARELGTPLAAEPTAASIYSALKKAFKVRKIGAFEVTRTGVKVYRTASKPSLREAYDRLRRQLAALPRAEYGGAPGVLLERASRPAQASMLEDSPFSAPAREKPDETVQAYHIRRAGAALAAAHMASQGDLRGFRMLGFERAVDVEDARERARSILVSALRVLTKAHQNVDAREAWLLKQIQQEANARLPTGPPVRRNNPVARVVVAGSRAAVAASRSGVAAVRAWVKTPRGRKMVAQALGVAGSLGLQVLLLEVAKHLTPTQADALARAVTAETGVRVSRDDVVTALTETSTT